MEEVFEFTKSQLAEAFRKWIEDFKNNPEEFAEYSADGKAEAEALLLYLTK